MSRFGPKDRNCAEYCDDLGNSLGVFTPGAWPGVILIGQVPVKITVSLLRHLPCQ